MKKNNPDQKALPGASVPAPAATTSKELDVRRPAGGYPAYSRYPAIEVEKNTLREYWGILLKHKWIVLTTLVVLVTIVAIGTFLTRPVYRAETRVEVGRDAERIMTGQRISDVETANVFNPLFLQTQVDILQSRDLARRVIQRLNLSEHEEFRGKPEQAAQAPALSENERDTRLVNAFQSRYAVNVGRMSRVVTLSFDAHDPKLAASVANALADEYIEWTMESRLKGVETAKTFLTRRVKEAEAELRKSEADYQQYAASHKIISLSDSGNITVERTAELNRQLVQAQDELRRAEAIYQQSQKVAPDELPQVLNDVTIQNLSKELSKQEQELANLSARYQPTYPAVKQVQEQVEQLKKQLVEAKAKIVKNIATQYQVAKQREAKLSAALSQSKGEAIQQNRESIELNMLRQKLDTDRKIYDDLLQQLRRAGVESEFQPTNIRVVQTAEVPLYPVKPRKVLNLGLAVLVGLALGVGLAFFREYLDNTIRTAEDVEKIVKLPPLGAIPSLQVLARRRMLNYEPNENGQQNGSLTLVHSNSELLSQHESLSSFAEAYRALRTSILLSSAEHAPRAIMVTSSYPAEGKTTIVANTAISLAQTDARVVVLDADMRRPRCHKILRLNNDVGLSNYLSGRAEIDDLIQKHAIPNLHVITAGPVPPNPAELLSSTRLRKLIEELCERFDHVIIDSPPVINVSDALIVSPLVDGVVIVVKGGQTPREAVLRTRQALFEVNARVFGVVLNSIDLDADRYYYKYKYSYYSYGSSD
ncbi:MAG TPA: polysaccharide biosynthesis tyrosine autokinase [Blastocatellia bacterium]|nr:polysaccharide biosynthesis tyrosine autokinase [Blastocatellia bacterium]